LAVNNKSGHEISFNIDGWPNMIWTVPAGSQPSYFILNSVDIRSQNANGSFTIRNVLIDRKTHYPAGSIKWTYYANEKGGPDAANQGICNGTWMAVFS